MNIAIVDLEKNLDRYLGSQRALSAQKDGDVKLIPLEGGYRYIEGIQGIYYDIIFISIRIDNLRSEHERENIITAAITHARTVLFFEPENNIGTHVL